MNANTVQPKKINEKLLIAGIGLLLFAMMLPSIFLLAKIAIGLIMISIATIAVKIASKTISSALEQNDNDQSLVIRSKVMNIAVGLVSLFAGGLSLLIIAKTGLIAACAAVTALALHEYIKDEEIGKNINKKFDTVADDTASFIVSSIERFIPLESREV